MNLVYVYYKLCPSCNYIYKPYIQVTPRHCPDLYYGVFACCLASPGDRVLRWGTPSGHKGGDTVAGKSGLWTNACGPPSFL